MYKIKIITHYNYISSVFCFIEFLKCFPHHSYNSNYTCFYRKKVKNRDLMTAYVTFHIVRGHILYCNLTVFSLSVSEPEIDPINLEK
jgi:hypothetical protein